MPADALQAIIARTYAPSRTIPVGCEHRSDDRSLQKNGPVPAAGWIKELTARPDGIWGRVEGTETARAMIVAREYRLPSPVLILNGDRSIKRLKGAGLVNSPNLELTALSRAEETDMDDDLPKNAPDLGRTATALGLTEAASVDQILDAIANIVERNSTSPDPAKYVPIGAVAKLMRSYREQSTVLSTQDTDARVETAMNAGHLSPGMRSAGRAIELCRQPPDQFDGFVSSSAAPFAHLFERKHRPSVADPGAAHVGAETAALCRQFDIDPKRVT